MPASATRVGGGAKGRGKPSRPAYPNRALADAEDAPTSSYQRGGSTRCISAPSNLPSRNMATLWTKAAQWIWTPKYREEDNRPGRYFLFRKSFQWTSQTGLSELLVHVSADSRYRLFVNGQRVSFGPCKSYAERWHYETVDILPFLVEGLNVISARVLRYSSVQAGSSSIISTEIPGLMVYGGIEGCSLSTDESWRCVEEINRTIIPHSEWNYILGPPFLSNNENFSEAEQLSGWELPEYDDSAWESAVLQFRPVKMLPIVSPWKLAPRPIPALPETPGRFHRVVKCQGSITQSEWQRFIKDDSPITIPAGETVTVDVEVETLSSAFINLQCGDGKGSTISLLYAECYEKDLGVDTAPFPKPRSKSNRSDSGGRLYGMKDIYNVVEGHAEHIFEPFWFRAFRYIQVHITAGDQPLIFKRFTLRETYYPLEISTKIQSSAELEKIWDISLRTLQNCRHETYEDCPFYEQNQFVSDSRLQMLFSYQLSSDDRLARKTLQEFHASQGPDGLIKAQFPSGFRSTQIPQFSLYFVAMVYDHMQYFADVSVVCSYLSTIDGILNYFDGRINDLGLVGRFEKDTWPFIDWVPQWFVPGEIFESCMPRAYNNTGAATFNSLLYIVALMQAAEICTFIKRKDTAAEYTARADALRNAVNRHCYEDGLYLDGPSVKEFSQHSQVFAVLSESITGPAARELVSRALQDTSLAQCSYSMKFYLFRAVEKVGLYTQLFPDLVEPWRRMIADNLTTWAEFEQNARSDCHGWSASPVYEIVAQVFGLSPAQPGFKRLRIAPRMELLEHARGTFFTPVGDVTVAWTKEGDLEVEPAVEIEAEIVLEGVHLIQQLQGGKPNVFKKDSLRLTP
ncbi:hypothetical protein N7462_006122 [Penicillium macrosclerotiorum]|uniref:uncharacterized protein n=1 Tax=Penicillium macrosclerotiorum TaxID=303699 RepID=UPI0025485E33|nr:uncharacterized protein N7462_006122 [Penicillium macrosclerotiorum]KAJ5682957.1 hypothetical protein N7462_006122 [Penicillium macrosclerotiorum]